MNAKLAAIIRRREALVARAAVQREAIGSEVTGWRRSLLAADLAYRLAQAVRARPLLAVVGVTAFLGARRRRLLLWIGRVFTAWEVYQAFRERWPRGPDRLEQ